MVDRKRYPAETSDYESDPGTIQYHDSHIDESDPAITSLYETPAGDVTAILEAGSGGAAEANRYHGVQGGGLRGPDDAATRLRGW